MPTTEEINVYYNNLPEDQRRQAIESGALEAAIQAQSLEPLSAYSPAPPAPPPPVEPAPPRADRPGEIEIPPGSWDIVQMRPFQAPANLRLPSGEVLTIKMLGGENEFGTVEVESSRGWSGAYALGTKGASPATLVTEGYKVRLMNPTYTTDNPATTVPGRYQEPWQARPLAISVVRTDEQGRELDDFAFGRAPAAGKYETASPETSYIIGGLSPDAMASIRTNLAAGGERAEAMRQSVQEDVLKSAIAYPQRPNYSGADIGPGIRGLTGEEWGKQEAARLRGEPPPTTMPQPDRIYIPRDIPEGYLPSDYSPGQAAMVALGQLSPEQRVAAIQSGAARQAYEKGDIGALNPYAQHHEFDPPPLRGTPAEGFQGKDILMTGSGLATLRGIGETPTPAMERAPQTGGPVQPPAMGRGMFVPFPFGTLGSLGREVQRGGEGFASYLGRAGKTWIEEVGGIRPEPMPLPSEISADAQRYMKGGITESEITTAPSYPMQADVEGKLGSQTTTITTFRPFVDAEVAVRGEAGKGGKETFTEMLVGPPGPFRYITNIGPVKLPFKIGPVGRNEKVPLASEAYRLRAAPGVFTREVGSTVGRGIIAPLGQGISALENPLQAGMAAPGVALAFGVGLVMLPGQIAMTTALNPAAGAGQVYGLVAPFSLAGKLRGARFDAKPTADIQFPGSGEGGVLLEVPKRGPIAGHVDLGGVVASRIMGRPVRSTVQVGEGGVFEIPLEWIDRPVVGGRAVSAEPLLRDLAIEQRLKIDLVGPMARVAPELSAKVPRTPQTVDVFRLGRAGEAEIEMFGEYFVPATREGTAYVKGAPKDLFRPVYETVGTAEPWMKGTEPLYTGGGQVKYPIVRPQTLFEKITRRPAEEIKLVPQKRLLGYEATMSRETSGRLGEFMLGKTSPKGTVIRPSKIDLTTFEPLEGLTPKEVRAEATYGMRDAPANLGLTEGMKGEPVFFGGIGAKPKATYTIKPEQFGQAPKALERFGLKAGLTGGRLEIEFGGVKGAPSLYDFPVGAGARGGRIEIRPGLAEQARGRAGGLLERIKKRGQAPIGIDFQRKVKIPGPGDRRGDIFDYVEAARQEDMRGAAASRAGDRSMDLSVRGYKISTGGAKAGSGGLLSISRGRKATLADIETEGAMSSFRFYTAPGSRTTLRMPGASLRGTSLGLATGALGLRGKVGVSETMLQGQKDATRLLDAVMERSRPTQALRMPGVLERERVREGVDILRLERQKVTQGVGQIPLIGERQQVREVQRVGQIERQVTVQKVDVVQIPKTRTEWPPPPGSPPGRPPGTPPYWAHLPGYLPGGRGGYWNFRPSLKRNPIATISDIARGGIRPPSLLGRIKGLGLTGGIGLPKPPKRGSGKRKSTGRKKGGRRKR